MNTPLQTLKGFRDFLPQEKRVRDAVAKKISQTFEQFGFEPLETPTLEYASLLLGKYGDEADKLVYSFTDRGERQVALRYDQTVPSARILAQYQNELPRYFRRYQIQNVFRADKPQKGRYREFTQADCDIFGAPEPLADAEILAAVYGVYAQLGLTDVVLEYNDRRLLQSLLSPFVSDAISFAAITQSLDKLDKITQEEVGVELQEKGLALEQVTAIFAAVGTAGENEQLRAIITTAQQLGVPTANLRFNPYLARGLDYYTGLIFEAKLPGASGSVGAGGRYDNLIEQLSGMPMSAVGFAIGFDRTVEVLLERNLLDQSGLGTQVLVTVFSEELLNESLATARELRQNGIRVELYPAVDKLAKQFKLADQKKIPFVMIIGQEEAVGAQVKLKNMQTGEEISGTITSVLPLIRKTS